MAATTTTRRGRKIKATPAVQDTIGIVGRQNEGHGRRLTSAFEALDSLPALAESRNRVLRLVTDIPADSCEIASVVECDVAMVIMSLRMANARTNAGVSTILEAVDVLSPSGVEACATSVSIYNFFDNSPSWNGRPERFRLHAVATQKAAKRIVAEVDFKAYDELLVSSILHDIGKLVLAFAYPGYPGEVLKGANTPGERVCEERKELGIDHAIVGGVLARRWGFPSTLAEAIERHHADDAEGEAAIIGLADILAHYEHEQPVAAEEMLSSARRVGLKGESLRKVLYEIPLNGTDRARHSDPCPLSKREQDVLKLLADGKVYKQIAMDLDLSTSTVRTHLHNVYGKIGAVDRAQAVLMARDHGWV